MKTLIINGSPKRNGDTSFLLNHFKQQLTGDIIELFSHELNVSGCTDCRYCWTKRKCKINDNMQIIYDILEEGIDNFVIASPIYDANFPARLVAINNRLQLYYVAKELIKQPIELNKKQGGLILVGGGSGGSKGAILSAKIMFNKVNAVYKDDNLVYLPNSDTVQLSYDHEIVGRVKQLAIKLNNNKLSN